MRLVADMVVAIHLQPLPVEVVVVDTIVQGTVQGQVRRVKVLMVAHLDMIVAVLQASSQRVVAVGLAEPVATGQMFAGNGGSGIASSITATVDPLDLDQHHQVLTHPTMVAVVVVVQHLSVLLLLVDVGTRVLLL
jgi:hypothetical protein